MKTILSLIVVALVASGLHVYRTRDSLKHITVESNAVAVDAGGYVVKFSVLGEFRETHMLFGGAYSKDKSSINPIWLSGLGIVDAKDIYARYPDFHRCSSTGSSLAKDKVEDLNLIPADTSVLKELKISIKEFEENFANRGDRVCVALIGKTLSMQSAEVPGQNIDMKNHLQPRIFRLINSSQRVNCKSLLDK